MRSMEVASNKTYARSKFENIDLHGSHISFLYNFLLHSEKYIFVIPFEMGQYYIYVYFTKDYHLTLQRHLTSQKF